MADIELKVGDRRPFLDSTLQDADGAVDLTNTIVQFVVRDSENNEVVNQSTTGSLVTIQSATAGTVRYKWAAVDLSTAGRFYAEWTVDFQDDTKARFPNTGHIPMVIKPALST